MSDCSSCGGCSGCSSTGGCSGCEKYGYTAGDLVLTEEEMDFLRELAQFAFLPVARKMGDLDPVYLEAGRENRDHMSLVLQCMEKKGVLSLDYSLPLSGFDYSAYGEFPIRGSIALTERGQKVLELLDLQGYDQE